MTALRPSSAPAARARRRRIVDSTRALLREREPDKVIVVDVAERAGVAPSTVYNLVGTRDEVMLAVLDGAITEVSRLVPPVDPVDPTSAATALLETAAEVLLADAVAYRRAIEAAGSASHTGWLHTTMRELLHERLGVVEQAFDGSIPISRSAGMIHVGFRGALISWSYGQLPDERLGPTGVELALHVLSTSARPDVAADIKRRLIALAQETT